MPVRIQYRIHPISAKPRAHFASAEALRPGQRAWRASRILASPSCGAAISPSALSDNVHDYQSNRSMRSNDPCLEWHVVALLKSHSVRVPRVLELYPLSVVPLNLQHQYSPHDWIICNTLRFLGYDLKAAMLDPLPSTRFVSRAKERRKGPALKPCWFGTENDVLRQMGIDASQHAGLFGACCKQQPTTPCSRFALASNGNFGFEMAKCGQAYGPTPGIHEAD